MFVGLCHASGVNAFHIMVVDECSQNGFYRATSPFDQSSMVSFVFCKFLMHFIVQRLVDAFIYLFKLRSFAATSCSQWAIFTVSFAASKCLFFVTFAVGSDTFKGQNRFISTFLNPFILVEIFVINKSFSFSFVLSKIGYPSIDSFLLTIL